MIRTVIFDMDGVIIDTEPIHHHAFFTLFAELGIPVTETEYATFLGRSTRNVFQRLKAEYNLPQEVESLLMRKRELFNKAFDEDASLDLLPGVRTLIEDLRRHDVGDREARRIGVGVDHERSDGRAQVGRSRARVLLGQTDIRRHRPPRADLGPESGSVSRSGQSQAHNRGKAQGR